MFVNHWFFWSHDVRKGSRNELEILIVSDMLQNLQHDAKINWRQFQNTFFKLGPVGEFEPCQKKIFQSKNSNWSKQTAAKVCLQDWRRGFLLHIVSNFSTWKKFNTSKSTSAQLTSICDLLAGNIIFTKNFKTFCNLGLYIIIYTI